MKALGRIVAVFLLVVGAVVLIAPQAMLSIAAPFISVPGLYFAALIRIVVGLVLLTAASESRLPKTLRVLGALIVLAGVLTPLFGPERARALLAWWSTRGADSIRVFGLVAMVLGAVVAYALSGHRRYG